MRFSVSGMKWLLEIEITESDNEHSLSSGKFSPQHRIQSSAVLYTTDQETFGRSGVQINKIIIYSKVTFHRTLCGVATVGSG